MPRALTALASLIGLGLAATTGCGDAGSTDGAADKGQDDPALGEAAQAVVSAQACVTISRAGSSGTVFDTEIFSNTANSSYGSGIVMIAGTVGSVQRQALIQFDLSSIPPGPNTNITGATLTLAQGNVAKSGPSTLNVHRITSLWSEGTVTWNNFAGGYDGTVWSTFSNAPQYMTMNLNTLVSAWVHGTYANHGLLLESPTNATSFYTSEYSGIYSRPVLNACYTVTCNPGFADCNNNGADGCETDTTSSAASCGACGAACNVPNATAACVASACAVGACNAGFADCNGNPADGCEASLTSNANCGGCGLVCPGGSACVSGVCQGGALYHGWPSPIAGCLTSGYDSTDPTVDGGSYPYNASDTLGCKAWKLAATICNSQPAAYADQNNWSCPSSGGFTDPLFGTFCASVGTQYSCSECPGACNAACEYHPLSLRNCAGQETNQPPGANGVACNANDGCSSNFCQNSVCRPATCADGVQDGAETGVDCGGGCAGCSGGQACNASGDCADGQCNANVCGVLGGGGCTVNSDCGSTLCQYNVCRPASCADGVQDSGETGVDCGGGVCLGCQGGQACANGADCLSGTCDGTRHCTVALYHGWLSPIAGCLTTSYDSTDPTVDGGSYPYNASDTLGCKAWKLAATICNSQPAAYSDQNNWSCPSSGGFTDPLFGTFCASVGTQYSCSECPGACNAACEYHPLSLRNCAGQETNQPPGANGVACNANDGCSSNFCQNSVCRPATCADGVQDGAETGVDCGGGCAGCSGGQACNASGDCADGQCNGDICGVVVGGACAVNSDCGSTLCQGAVCRPTSCGDGVQDSGETGVDCGGGVCLGCQGGQACTNGADCLSGTCDGTSHCTVALYHGWLSPIAGCLTTGYDSTDPTVDGGSYPFNASDSLGCKAWKLAATICNAQPTAYSDENNWSCPSSGGFTDPLFGTFCASVGTQYSCSGCPGACNAACAYHPLSLRNCSGQETNEQ